MSNVPSFISDDEDRGPIVAGDTTGVLRLAREMVRLSAEVAELEEMLSTKKAELYDVQHKKLPDEFMRSQTDRIGVAEAGVDIVLEQWAKANIPEENRTPAHKWLEDHGHGYLLKSTLVMEMSRGDHAYLRRVEEVVLEFMRTTNERPSGEWRLDIKSMVPWNTLTAFVKEQIKDPDAEPLPLELLGATVGPRAVIKKRKAK